MEAYLSQAGLIGPEIALTVLALVVLVWDLVTKGRDSRQIGYVFTLAPDKHVIYPEYFPRTLHPASSESRMDQVFDAVAGTGVAVDLRPRIVAAKARERVYHLTDSHWNARAAKSRRLRGDLP